jgi:hypothetical protein
MKKSSIFRYISLVIVLFLATSAFKCPIKELTKEHWNSIDAAEFDQKALDLQIKENTVKTLTPKGVTIYSRSAPSADTMNAIEASLDINEAQAKQYWNQTINRQKYAVYVIRAEREFNSDGQYVPAFAVPIRCPGDGYCGSIYDKGKLNVSGKTYSNLHYVFAAERVVGNAWLIPEYTRNFADMAIVSSFGGEHKIEEEFDFIRYLQDQVHLNGGHPLLALPADVMEEIFTRNNLRRDGMIQVSSRFVPRVMPQCAPTPEGDTRRMCVVE